MPGFSLSKGDIEGLKADIAAAKAPKEVIALLTKAELQLLHILDPRCLHPEDAKTIIMPLVEVFRVVREHVQRNVPLPEDFPAILSDPFDPAFKSEHQSDIGLIVESGADLETIKAWVLGKLAEINQQTQDKIRHLLSFERRGWFDGPVSVEIISKDEVPSAYWEAGTEAPPELTPREKKLKELANRRETKELSPYDFDLNFVFQLNEIDTPLRREDVAHQTGFQAVVLSPEDLETLGFIDFIHRTGERMKIDPENLNEDDVLILYPEDLGNSEIEKADLKLLRETLKAEGITFKDFLDDDESIIDRIAGINRNRDALKRDKPENSGEADVVASRQKNELLALYLQKYKERKAVKDETRQKLSNLLGDVLGGSNQA